MNKIYSLNSWFEYEISTYPNFRPDRSLQQFQDTLQNIFLLLADKNDFVLLQSSPPADFLHYLKLTGLETGQMLTINSLLPHGQLIEWGKTSEIINGKITYNSEIIAHSRLINSKIQQTIWKQNYSDNPCHATITADKNQLEIFIAKHGYPVVIKNEFNLAGRGFVIIHNQEDFFKFIFPANTTYVVEKWAERTSDFSLLFDVTDGTINFLSMTQMDISSRGQFQGLRLTQADENILTAAFRILQSIINATGYSGPLAMDGFQFTENGKTKIQFFSEINFRYSMGRILYELVNKLRTPPATKKLEFTPRNFDLSYKDLLSRKLPAIALTPLFEHNGKRQKALLYTSM